MLGCGDSYESEMDALSPRRLLLCELAVVEVNETRDALRDFASTDFFLS